MHRIPHWRWMVVLALSSLALAACADGGGDADGGVEADDDAVDDAQEDEEGTDADAAAEWEGEDVELVVAYGEGGGYDLEARLIAPHLEEHLGADVTVENVDGAGGLVAANSIVSSGPDDPVIGFISGQGLAGSVLGGADGAQFDPLDLSYVARLSADGRMLFSGADSEYQTIDDVLEAEDFTFASSGPGGSDHLDGSVLFSALDIDGEIITGYAGGAETRLAALTQETDGASGTYGGSWQDVDAEGGNVLLTIGDEPHELEPDAAVLMDLDMDDEAHDLAASHVNMQELGRVLFAPPDMPADRLEALRSAFQEIFADEDFQQEMDDGGFPLEPMDGSELEELIEQTLDAPQAYVDILEEAYADQ